MLKRLASLLPPQWQELLKQWHFARQIRKGTFVTTDPEWLCLADWISPGDFVIDIGANVGHYTARMSQLVGAEGRVFAFEPIPQTFRLLASTASLLSFRNTTLLNLAASSDAMIAHMHVPTAVTGLPDYYLAHLDDREKGVPVVCVPVDSIHWPD